MKNIFTLFVCLISLTLSAQKAKTDANLIGHVVCCDEHIPYASVTIKGTTMGTMTDETGHYQLVNLPEGQKTVVVSIVGYKTQEQSVTLEAGKTTEIKFELEEDVLDIDEVVVSANRSEQKRTEAPVIVNTISPKLFNTSQSVTLAEGLNFAPGIRVENNCQNCGFSQVRMNGMEGPHSQILINSRPIFSTLAGVYGLELIPSTMIERVEVVRGGGSSLYGGNAIAGVVNVIMKEPVVNSYEVGATYGSIGVGTDGDAASDYTVSANATVVSDDTKSGVSVYGVNRKREMYDANDDGFSELAPLTNLTFGTRAFHKFGSRDKLAFDFFAINEQRDGGNMQDYPLHERDIAEAVEHDLKVAGLTYDKYFREYDMLSVYASGQFLNRDAYYGAEQSLSDYGNTKDNTFNVGIQYKAVFDKSSLVAGVENTSDFLVDKKLGYLDLENAEIDFSDSSISYTHTENTTIADQSSITTAVFAQYDITLGKLKASAGARLSHYEIKDLAEGGAEPVQNDVFSPRVSVMYDILDELQARVTYANGYRAPQIFDEDLHIESSGLHQIVHENDADLKQETSNSFMASLDFNKLLGKIYTGFLVEGFYTKLDDAFANEIGEADADGVVTYTRINSTGATVTGVNMELRLKPLKNIEFSSGFTIQSSEYEEEQDWGDVKYLRTPDQYGFFAIDWDFYKGFCLSATGDYTGSMLVLHTGLSQEEYDEAVADGTIEEGDVIVGEELVESESFFDLGVKLSYTVKLNGASLQFLGGVKNIFNSYQSDFDKSIYRDPAYMYGPLSPRTIYFGIKFGNLL